ncbi:2976_t:CDS:2 [Ambispora leptoticha]|uniref:2976_t:CDS:1 n=1 Tax=Ambispora leptoticha TaxID=144679 RepID=A0A9N8WK46_9GLOM|nr:2976_t:CDS:2 [Ambispora leptoticha]
MTLAKLSIHEKDCIRKIDTTGKKHIFYVQNEKYQSLRRRNRRNDNNNKNKNPCKNCNQSNEYLALLEKRIEQIANKVDQLANINNSDVSPDFNINKSSIKNNPDFSQMDTDDLINIATYLSSNTAHSLTNIYFLLPISN